MISKKILFTCKTCGGEWLDYPSRKGIKKYCSRKCLGLNNKKAWFQKGNQINLGKEYSKEHKENISQSLSGKKQPKVSLSKLKEKNPMWNGKNATYSALHYRVRTYRKKPIACQICGTEERKIEWANITGDFTNLKDYIAMCTLCHRRYDLSDKYPEIEQKVQLLFNALPTKQK